MRPCKEVGSHLVKDRKSVALTNETYKEVRDIKASLEKEIGIKLNLNQTLTIITKHYVSNNRNK